MQIKGETVIRDFVSNSKISDKDDIEDENKSKRVGSGDSAPLTPTHSLILSQITTPNTSFAFLINPTIGHLRDYISDYATRVSVVITSLIIFQSDIPNKIDYSC